MLNSIFQDNLVKKITKNTSIIFSGNSIAFALNIISFTLMARALGPESLAFLVLAQTYVLIINDIFNIQTWESMIKFGSDVLKKDRITNLIKTNVILDISSAGIAFIFVHILVRAVVGVLDWDESLIKIISIYSLFILFNITTLTIGIPRLFDQFLLIAKVNVLVAIFRLLCILYLMFTSKSLLWYVCTYLVMDILINLILIVISCVLLKGRYGLGWWREPIEIDWEQIRFIWWTNLRTVIRIPVQRLDMVIISCVMSVNLIGVYKVYKEIAGLFGRVIDPLNQAIYPEFTSLLGNNNINQTRNVLKKIMLLLLGASIIILVPLIFLSEFIVNTFYGKDYIVEIGALYAMLILNSVKFALSPINSLFIAAGFAKTSFLIIFFSNIIYLIAAFYLGKMFGIYGIVIAFFIQWLLNKGPKIFYLKKYSNDWGKVIR